MSNILLISVYITALSLLSSCKQRNKLVSFDMGKIHAPFNKSDSAISIILMDGARIHVKKNQPGIIARQAGIKIEQTNGVIVYTQEYEHSPGIAVASFNEIRVPRRTTAWVRLTDGSQLCLNANSSFRFPLSFSPSDRRTSLSGEAYFQVAQNGDKPFMVVANGVDIETLGGTFNSESYPDRSSSEIALEKGSIRITCHRKRVTPKPGKIVSISKNGDFRLIKRNMLEVTSYKDGYLFFDGAILPRIFSEVECWYGVKLIPKEPVDSSLHYHVDNHPLSGSLSDFLNRFLILKNLHFEIHSQQHEK